MCQFRSLVLLVALALGFGWDCGSVQARRSPEGIALQIPEYGDKSAWGIYVRRLQDTVAKRWYDEIQYYNYPSSVSRGVVTVKYTIDAAGRVVSRTVVSNTANEPLAQRALAAVGNARIQAIPPDMQAKAPQGLTILQTFRLRDNDPTDYGLASSYPQLLLNRFPDTGAAENLDLRRFYPLQRFIYQSRILSITAA